MLWQNGVRAVLDEAVVKNLWEKIEKEVPSNNLFDEVQLKVCRKVYLKQCVFIYYPL